MLKKEKLIATLLTLVFVTFIMLMVFSHPIKLDKHDKLKIEEMVIHKANGISDTTIIWTR